MQAFQTHTAAQPIGIQPLQTQQKPHVTEAEVCNNCSLASEALICGILTTFFSVCIEQC